MAISYEKALRTVTFTMKDGTTTFEVADTTTAALGSAALGAWERGGIVSIPQTSVGSSYIVKFNADAVLFVNVETDTDTVEATDDTCAME